MNALGVLLVPAGNLILVVQPQSLEEDDAVESAADDGYAATAGI
jgi:hypothetical protein